MTAEEVLRERELELGSQEARRIAPEEALRRSEELYRTIVSTANEGIWLVDLEARTVYANERMAAMLGFTPEEMSRLSVLDCAFPEDAEKHRERIGLNLVGGVEQFDTRFRRKDGTELLVLGCTSGVRGVEGTIIGALGMFTDITERVRSERERTELLEREQQARARAEEAQRRLTLLADASALLASSLDYETTLKSLAHAVVPAIADWSAVHLVDEDGTVRQIVVTHSDRRKLDLARRLEELAPYDPEAPIGVPKVLRTGEPELVSDVGPEFFEPLVNDQELLQVVRELNLSSWIIVPLAARGRLLGALTLATSESARHYGSDDVALAEVLARRAALAVDNARLYREAQRVAGERAAILSQMTDGLIMCDKNGTVTFMNGAARRLYGRDFVGRSLEEYQETRDIVDDQGRNYPAEDLPLWRALARGEVTIDAEALLRRPDGTEAVIQRSATPVVAPDGTQVGAILIIRDVTSQRQLEREKEQFLSAAAHDLKTPLTSLMGMAQVLQRRITKDKGTAPAELLDGLKRIERNATRMAGLINELLDLSQLETGQHIELNRQATDLIALVSGSINAVAGHSSSRRVSIETELPSLVGNWDASRIERVVGNLLSNALKYSPESAPVTVTMRKEEDADGDWAVLNVRDQGIGIPEEDLPRVFDRFHRGRNVGPGSLGTGIGLAAAKQIVEQHGGTIEVSSKEGEGSTFTVRLPTSDQKEQNDVSKHKDAGQLRAAGDTG